MNAWQLALMATLIAAFALVSQKSTRSHLTMPMIFVGAGWVTATQGWVELDLEIEGITLLGEFTLAVILFSDAVRINVPALTKEYQLPLRLLGIGMPLTVLAGTVLASLLIPELSIWEAALVGSILAPTDAALGQAVVDDPSVPLRVRQGLNVESGLNDGLALPAVSLFVALSVGEESDAGFWVRFVVQQVGLGILVGVGVGVVAGWLMKRARAKDWVEGVYAQLGTLSIAFIAFTTATALDANGFLAAFTAGLAYGMMMPRRDAENIDEYSEDTGRLLAMVAFFIFGNVLLHDYLGNPTVAVILCAIAALTIGRMIPVAIALAGMRPAKETVLFVGWFGPRGLASILFGLTLLEEELPAANQLFGIIAWTVLGSVVLHGVSATWGARKYGEWYDSMTEDELAEMPEAVEVSMGRTRWSS